MAAAMRVQLGQYLQDADRVRPLPLEGVISLPIRSA